MCMQYRIMAICMGTYANVHGAQVINHQMASRAQAQDSNLAVLIPAMTLWSCAIVA